jgi:hypothetical protein
MTLGEVVLAYVSCLVGTVIGFLMAVFCLAARRGDDEMEKFAWRDNGNGSKKSA